VAFKELSSSRSAEPSGAIRQRVLQARDIPKKTGLPMKEK
jgi:hypothetical protein